MDYEITKGTIEDYEDIVDFGNYVFGLDFSDLLPKLYKGHKETSKYHHLIKEANRIKAMIGNFPLSLTVLHNNLKGYGIGTVSVHRYSRNSGYMKKLMNNVMNEILAEKGDFAVLSGQRQRYEYWGFTPCGIELKLNFNSSNIKHYNISFDKGFKFVEYNEAILEHLTLAVKLYNSQKVHAGRKEKDFIEIAKSWKSNIYFIYQKDCFVGYLCSAGEGQEIKELYLTTPEEIDKVIVAYMKCFELDNLNISLYMHRNLEFNKLCSFCESYSINSCANINIINYGNVIKAFMDLKNSINTLSDGTLVINILDKGRYMIKVENGTVTVEETDLPYDMSLSHFDASALLFSHSSLINASINYENALVKAWFPLPLFYPELDNV